MADNRKLAQGLMMMTPSARADLAQREGDIQRGKTVELLRRAGKEMYDNPIVNTAIGFTPVLGDVQAAGETMAALNRGAPWQETAGYAAGMLPFVPMIGKTVWHGSPKIFDEFNLNLAKEGGSRSARGEGLYFSESPDFASSFRAAGGEGGNFGLEAGPTQGIANLLAYKGEKGEELARKYYPKLENIDEQIAIAKKAIDENSGLYKVDLPDEQIAKMIDYDLPLSQQSESVREALLKVNDPYINEALTTNPVYNEVGDYWSHMGNTYGSKNEALQDVMPANIISGQRGKFKSPQEVSQRFYEAGIPGTQYAERGTRNYVVFSDEIPQILERNNQPVAQALRNYGLEHRPMTIEGGASQLHELTPSFGEDVYGKQAMQFFGSGDPREKKALEIMKSVRGNPDAPVTIYRGVPEGVNQINQGDWVTIVPEVAADYGNVISQQVPASHITSWPDSLMEFGYYPPKAK